MSNESFLRRADCFKLSHQGARISSHIEISKLKRLSSALADDSGNALVHLDFAVDEQGIRHASGEVCAAVKMPCQRCLHVMEIPVRANVNVAFVHDDDQARGLPKQYDPVIVDEENCVDLLEVIEDDILLALPLVSYHPLEVCTGLSHYEAGAREDYDTDVEDGAITRPNPFSILEKLKKPRS